MFVYRSKSTPYDNVLPDMIKYVHGSKRFDPESHCHISLTSQDYESTCQKQQKCDLCASANIR